MALPDSGSVQNISKDIDEPTDGKLVTIRNELSINMADVHIWKGRGESIEHKLGVVFVIFHALWRSLHSAEPDVEHRLEYGNKHGRRA